MRLRALTTAALLPLSMVGAVAATAETATDCRGDVCRVQTYLQCGSTGHLYHYAVDGMAQLTYDAPEAGYQDGAGCGEYDETLFATTSQDGIYSFDFGGFVEGNFDEFTVTLFNLDFGTGRIQDVTLATRITINGKSVFGGEVIESVAGDQVESPFRLPIVVTPEPTSSQLANVYRFTVTGVSDMIDTMSNPDKQHQIIVTIDVSTDDGPREGQAPDYVGFNPWVWGASDAASGVTFNELEDAPKGTIVEAKDYAAE